MTTLWGGRFSVGMDERMWRFNASIDFDVRLAQADVLASKGWARALERANVLSPDETSRLLEALDVVASEFEQEAFILEPTDEDIHTAVERRLTELVGLLAGKLHTGRSRNDQVATDLRLWMMQALPHLGEAVRALQQAIVAQAEIHLDLLMPGYTHLQPAQPVRFGHWLLSYFWMLERDRERLEGLLGRVAECPLGAAALAGTAYAIDREALAHDLGFDRVMENSMDAVSARDIVVEALSWASILATHLSRLAEDLILYSSAEFGFVRLGERYATGSSIMPQKRNPDSMELVRGKTGRLVGNLMGLLMVVKGLPSSYDKDLQEDKEPLFDTVDTLADLVPIVAGVVGTLEVHPEAMRAALHDAMLATDVADYMVKKGLPFRQAHDVVGRIVRLAEEQDVDLAELSLHDYRAVWDGFASDLFLVLNFEDSVEARAVRGGTARSSVERQLELAQKRLESVSS